MPQLNSHFEHSDGAFYIVIGSASVLAMIVFVFGIRVLKRVRRVALTARHPLRSSLPMQIPPTPTPLSQPEPGTKHAMWRGGWWGPSWSDANQRTAWWRKMMHHKQAAVSRGRPSSMATCDEYGQPMWINEKADLARARDAVVHERHEKEKEFARMKTMKREWKESAKRGEPWESRPHEWDWHGREGWAK